MRVLYDGWPLVEHPNGSQAVHLMALLEHLPGEVQPMVALPQTGPAAAEGWLPAGVEVHRAAQDRNPRGRLEWEQRTLPGLQRTLKAAVLHTTAGSAALFGRGASLCSPAAAPVAAERPRGFFDRLRLAALAGGQARLSGTLWPADLPDPEQGGRLHRLPPLLEPHGLQSGAGQGHNGGPEQADLDLPESYILGCAPPGEVGLGLALDAWSWAAGPIGQSHPLLLAGVEAGQADFARLVSEREVGGTVEALPALPPWMLRRLVEGAAAVFHPGHMPPWGSLLRLALALGKPVIAVQDRLSQALVGPAAYLAPADNPRTLGAGILTVIVNEEVASSLSEAGKKRAATWRGAGFSAALWEVYRGVSQTD